MIKKFPLFLASILLTLTSFAQENAAPANSEVKDTSTAEISTNTDESRVKPVDGDWGFTFNISGLISDLTLNGNEDMVGNQILFFRHYVKDDLALRLGFGYNSNRQKTLRKDSLPGVAEVEFDSTYSRGALAIGIGIEKHLSDLRRLDPYIGGELGLQFIGKEKISWNQLIKESAGETTVEGERTVDGGFGIGFFGIVGFNYFITERVSIGGEYKFGYNYLKTGGNYTESEITTPPTGSVTSDFSKGRLEFRDSGFEVSSTASIVFSVFF